MENSKRERLILVIDDHPEHLQVIQQVLDSSTVPCQIITLSNSRQAIDFLHRRGTYEQATRPDLVLLDGQLSDGQGQTFLLEVKSDASLRRIPTIVLSPDTDHNTVLNTYQLQCNSYVIKPQDLIHLREVMGVIESFWLNIVTLPLE